MLFYKTLMEMECRKDIILENRFINKKTHKSTIPIWTRYKSSLIDNKYRWMYFVGFCGLFSMGIVYDYIFESNDTYSKIIKYITPTIYPHTIIQQPSTINQSLATIFIQWDGRQGEITPQMMNRLSSNNRTYDKDYVNIETFAQFFQHENQGQLRNRIKFLYIQ